MACQNNLGICSAAFLEVHHHSSENEFSFGDGVCVVRCCFIRSSPVLLKSEFTSPVQSQPAPALGEGFWIEPPWQI